MDRTIHGITLHDDLAWMEPMRGARWMDLVKKEQVNSRKALACREVRAIQDELTAAAPKKFVFRSGKVRIAMNGHGYLWTIGKGALSAADLVSIENYIWTVEDVSKGAEVYAIICRAGSAILWKHVGVGPYVAIVDGRCYCLEAKKQLVYYRLVSWDAESGRDRRVHYEETDYRYNLELIRGNGCAFLRRQAGGKQDIFKITEDGLSLLEGISPDSRRFVLGGGEYLMWMGYWTCSAGLAHIRFPSFAQAVPEWLNTQKALLITRWKGSRTLWSISSRAPVKLWSGVGTLLADPWDGNKIVLTRPGFNPITSLPKDLPKVKSTHDIHEVKSADGTQIPFLLIGSKKPRGLLVVGYGAYGIPTSLSTSRWIPLLRRDWAIAICLMRGGGDHTPEWEDAGRLQGRVKVLEDAEAVVREAQKLCGIGAAQTVMYGRSAGGLWVGGLCARYPDGSLAGGAYMEVPYLDVLRTTTNRSLPLTDIETDEFGLPGERLSDLASMLKWSPMDILPAGGTPGVRQLIRTGLNDPQVFVYESVKWVVRCRGAGNSRIFLAIEDDQGHFVEGDIGARQRAEDICFLLKFPGI